MKAVLPHSLVDPFFQIICFLDSGGDIVGGSAKPDIAGHFVFIGKMKDALDVLLFLPEGNTDTAGVALRGCR